MRCLLLLGALLLALLSPARAQVQISAQTERSNFLLFERVDLLVSVQNMTGSDLILSNDEGQPWLSFLVSRLSRGTYLPVRPERDSNFNTLNLKVGETKTLRINVTPLFSFREPGDYRVSAVINLPGAGQMISDPVPFNVDKGRVVWSQVRPTDTSERTFSLLRFSPKSDSTKLYLRVESIAENIVFANIALGELASSADPDAKFDPQGNLHVLQPTAMGTYLYTRADIKGQIVQQSIFKSTQMPGVVGMVPPRLAKMDDGNIIVIGGLEENPDMPREKLSDGQNASRTADRQAPAPANAPQ